MAYGLLAAAFTAVALVGLSHTAPGAERASLERGLSGLAAALEGLRHGAARNPLDPSSAGAVRSVVLEVPDGAWLALGGDPDPDGDGRLENGTPVASEAAALYRVGGDAKRRLPIPLGIREGVPGPGGWLPASEPLVLGPGNHLLGLEAILDPASGERAALVRAGDNLTLPYLRPS
ncbi:MAG: hypothetical protein QXO51_01780 [Halobacteria archaeon]